MMIWNLARAIPLGLLLLGWVTTSVAGQRRANPELGLNVQPVVTQAHVAMLRELGIRKVRMSVWWGWWEGEQKSRWDEMMPRLRSAGIEVLPIITAPPRRLNARSWEELARETVTFADGFLRRHPVPYIQVGNEWDTGSPWFGPESGIADQRERGRRYGRYLNHVSSRLRRLHPGTKIVAGGISHTDQFVRGLYETGGGAFDVVAIHTYGDHTWGEPWGRGATVKRIQAEFGRADPVWVTEFGIDGAAQVGIWRREHGRAPSRAELDQYQLDNWRVPLDEDPGRFLYDRVYGFQLPPGTDGGTGWPAALNPLDYSYGLLRADNRTPRPAYNWLRSRQYNAGR